jgi:hypothetical protein
LPPNCYEISLLKPAKTAHISRRIFLIFGISMPRKKPHDQYFDDVKQKAVHLKSLALTNDAALSIEQLKALENFKAAAAAYLLGDQGYRINKRGITAFRQNGFEAIDISGQPSNVESEGIRHVGALIRIGELTVFIERDDS